ncbi:FIG004556: membrane metalloprotease [hydrothermal vent metagenome]|uniref:FIG004556: membrane metalloprotease n=1 Tax=hydrothermal vent metagenome TaxID=652676 RepID=A0A3B0W5S8_9ZZZZ
MSSIPYTIAVWAAPVLFAITLHEAAHGWVANKLGDPTAKSLGRITANPLKHIDPMGTIIVPLFLALSTSLVVGQSFIMGWAKPVPVQPRYFKSPLLDMALVAIAGPVSNFFMACFWAMFIQLSQTVLEPSQTLAFLLEMGKNGIIINVVLMVLNLFPIPPLDGGRVVAGVLPPNLAMPFMKLERYGMVIIILLLVSGILGKIMWPIVVHFVKIIGSIFGL